MEWVRWQSLVTRCFWGATGELFILVGDWKGLRFGDRLLAHTLRTVYRDASGKSTSTQTSKLPKI
jgi:hypothetical protein